MSLPLRFRRAAIAATIFLIALSFIAPAIAAVGAGEPVPAGTLPANDTSLSSIVAYGTEFPLSSPQQHYDTITLFKFEMNQTTFPGPRSMAFGPRYIELKTNMPTLLIITAATCVGILAFVFYRRRKAEAKAEDSIENTPENGDEKQV